MTTVSMCPNCGEHPDLCHHPEMKLTLYCDCGFFETAEVDTYNEAEQLWNDKVVQYKEGAI